MVKRSDDNLLIRNITIVFKPNIIVYSATKISKAPKLYFIIIRSLNVKTLACYKQRETTQKNSQQKLI